MVIKTSWDFSPLYKSDKDPAMLQDRKKVSEAIDHFVHTWKPKLHELNHPATLKKALDDYEKLSRTCGSSGKEGYYFFLRAEQDQLSPIVKAKYNQVSEFGKENAIKLEFFTLHVSKIEKEHQPRLIAAPELKEYRHFLQRLFQIGAHKLSESEEKILTLKSQSSYENWTKLVSSSISKEERTIKIKGKNVKKNFSQLSSELNSSDKPSRDAAAKAFNEIVASKREIAEAEINSILADKKVDDMLRGFSRPDEATHLSDDIETEVVDTVLKAVEKNFQISRDFYAFKAKLLGLKKLAYHERNVPYTVKTKQYTFQQSCDLISKVFGNLDPEFHAIFTRFIENGHIDAFPKKGKRDGAFCASNGLSWPTYILMNHDNHLEEVLTLAHESGHGIHAELSRKQNALNFGQPISSAEVASTFMEDFVLQELMKEADDEARLSLMVKKLDSDTSTIIRQVACYRFEQELHKEFRKRGFLSADDIGAIFQKNMHAYMGPAVEQSPGAENWWIYWIHIRYFFYVYSYASGLLISKALQAQVAKDPQFILKVKEFLSAGSSASPREIFHKLGIDITKEQFWHQGLERTQQLLKETQALAKKLKKI
jgi:oligoendopeptidase F